ncbi:M14 family metallopeptidase [Rohdeia mirabilis]
MTRATRLLVLAALATACVATPGRPDLVRFAYAPDELPTTAEASGFTRTSEHAAVVAHFERIATASDLVAPISLGTSHEGRDLLAVLIADPPIASAAEARASSKPLVFLFGNIHAGEVCGKEALGMIARELAGGSPLLEHVNVAILANYNPDGNDAMAPDNRPGQIGPETMGERANALGLDLNRDWVKADAPETRAFIRFLNAYDPLVIVDTHTTNGSHHRYTITHQGPKHPAGDRRVIEYVRDTLLPDVDARFAATTDYESFVYGNFGRRHQIWTTYPAEPRYGVAYRGLRNRLSVLSEAYSYATYRDRVLGTKAFCEAVLEHVAQNAERVVELCRTADARAIERGAGTEPSERLPLRVEARPFPGTVVAKGFEEYDANGERTEPGAPRDWEVEVVNDFVPTLEVDLPRAYVFGPEFAGVAEHLELHGIRLRRLDTPVTATLERYRITDFERAEAPFEGRARADVRAAERFDARLELAVGTYVVPTAQPLGALAAYLLEPQATDGLAAWGFVGMVQGEPFPIARTNDVAVATD